MKKHNPFVVYILRLPASLSYNKNNSLMLVSNSPPLPLSISLGSKRKYWQVKLSMRSRLSLKILTLPIINKKRASRLHKIG
jgi:hypothetical protein